MATHKQTKKKPLDPVKNARLEAEKDIHLDPEFAEGDPTDDLDEGELARRDNSDEEGLDALEKQRPRSGRPVRSSGSDDRHSGKGSEK